MSRGVARLMRREQVTHQPPTLAGLVAAAAERDRDECWTGTLPVSSGYSYTFLVCDGRKSRLVAHRVMYVLLRGDIADGLVLDHLCRNTPCYNPWHLEPVTNGENQARGIGRNAAAIRARLETGKCWRGHDDWAPDSEGRGVWCRECNRMAARAIKARARAS